MNLRLSGNLLARNTLLKFIGQAVLLLVHDSIPDPRSTAHSISLTFPNQFIYLRSEGE